jgi:hypothetical protein
LTKSLPTRSFKHQWRVDCLSHAFRQVDDNVLWISMVAPLGSPKKYSLPTSTRQLTLRSAATLSLTLFSPVD